MIYDLGTSDIGVRSKETRPDDPVSARRLRRAAPDPASASPDGAVLAAIGRSRPFAWGNTAYIATRTRRRACVIYLLKEFGNRLDIHEAPTRLATEEMIVYGIARGAIDLVADLADTECRS